MTGPATAVHLNARSLAPLTPEQVSAGTVRLEDVWGQMLAAVPSLKERMGTNPPDETLRSLVIQVQCAAVLRWLSNPEGKYQETGDDYSYRRDQVRSTGAVELTTSEVEMLQARADEVGIFTIRPMGTPVLDRGESPYLWHPFPCGS